MSIYAGVDIGGTFTKVGVLADELKTTSFPTPRDKDALVDAIVHTVNSLCLHKKLDGVGVGVPGPVDKNGTVAFITNLGISDFNAKELLEQRLDTRVAVSNDANVAALSECEKYGLTDAVLLTLGTGVGSGIVIGGRIYEGPNYMGGELGHMIICADGIKCGCGMNGCLEAYASASALIKNTKSAMLNDRCSTMWKLCPDIDKLNGSIAFEAEKLGDGAAKKVIDDYVKYLGIGIINICNIFRPQAVIIGGGVSAQGENLLDKLRKFCRKMDYGYKFAPAPQILQASGTGVCGSIAMIKKIVEEKNFYERSKWNKNSG